MSPHDNMWRKFALVGDCNDWQSVCLDVADHGGLGRFIK